MVELSIVLPTCNRASLLGDALALIDRNTRLSHEIIVVDGASTDHTQQVLADAQRWMGDRLKVIREPRRQGFVRAANIGFKAATGKNLTWLNDDARPAPRHARLGRVPLGRDGRIGRLRRDVSSLAFDAEHRVRNDIRIRRVSALPCARNGCMRIFPSAGVRRLRSSGISMKRFYVCAADPDLSLKAWHAGLAIVPACGCLIDHDELEDARRSADSSAGIADNARLFAKWNLPEKSRTNEFDAKNPCTLRGMQSPQTVAA